MRYSAHSQYSGIITGKCVMKKYLLLKGIVVSACVLGIMLIFTASFGQGDGWKQFESRVFQLAERVVQSMLHGNMAENDLPGLAEEIERLEMEFARQAPQCPSQKACEGLQHIILKTKDVIGMTSGGISSLQEGKSLAALRQALHNYKSSGGYQGGQASRPASQPASATSSGGKLDFAVGVVHQKGGKGKPIELKNQGVMHSGDHYKIIFMSSQPCYVYVFQTDESNIYGLFPLQNFRGVSVNLSNPIQPKQKVVVPAQDKSFVLDNRPGLEQIYIMVLRERDHELEQQYQHVLYTQNANDPQATQVAQANMMRSINSKGIAGVVQDEGSAQQAGATAQPKQESRVAQVSYQADNGQTFPAVIQRLQTCTDCVRVITFTHQ